MARKTKVMAVSLDEELASLADKLAEDRGWSRSGLYSRALSKNPKVGNVFLKVKSIDRLKPLKFCSTNTTLY